MSFQGEIIINLTQGSKDHWLHSLPTSTVDSLHLRKLISWLSKNKYRIHFPLWICFISSCRWSISRTLHPKSSRWSKELVKIPSTNSYDRTCCMCMSTLFWLKIKVTVCEMRQRKPAEYHNLPISLTLSCKTPIFNKSHKPDIRSEFYGRVRVVILIPCLAKIDSVSPPIVCTRYSLYTV